MRGFRILSLVTLLAAAPHTGVANDRPTLNRTTTSTSSITGEVMEQMPNNTRDFRTIIQQAPGVYDEVNINTGKRHVNSSELRLAPDGWTCTQSGHSWECSGHPISPGTQSYFAFESAPDVKISNTVEYELRNAGRRILKTRITPTYLQPYALQTDLQNILNYPAGVGAGEPFLFSPATDAYSGGRWGFQVDGQEIPQLDPADLGLKWDLTGGSHSNPPSANPTFVSPGTMRGATGSWTPRPRTGSARRRTRLRANRPRSRSARSGSWSAARSVSADASATALGRR
jgi:hypothetical protein